jgi:hypothetical protein
MRDESGAIRVISASARKVAGGQHLFKMVLAVVFALFGDAVEHLLDHFDSLF